LENDDKLTAIDTATNTVIGEVPIGQAPQAIAYVPNAVSEGNGTANLQPLGAAGQTTHLVLATVGTGGTPTSISLFDQGLIQILEASVTGLQPKHPYVLAFAAKPGGSGALEPLATFMTNPAGSAIVNASGPIRQVVQGDVSQAPRFLVIAEAVNGVPGKIIQVQRP